MDAGPASVFRRSLWIGALVLVALGAIGVSAAYYQRGWARIKSEQYHAIASIAKLKSDQVRLWRAERRADATIATKNPFFADAVGSWLSDGGSGRQILAQLRAWLDLEKSGNAYESVFLAGPGGTLLLASSGSAPSLHFGEHRLVRDVVSSNRVVLSDLFFGDDGGIYLDAIAPVLDRAGRPAAALVMRSAADTYLFPLIETWPTPSPTAETLLVERDGNSVVFLNDLRQQPKSALQLRFPLTRVTLPAVQAVRGRTGMFEGSDYRGVPVVADLRPVPDSRWFIVAKVDVSEVFADARYRALISVMSATILLLVAAGITALTYRHRQARLYKSLYRSELDQRAAWEEMRITLYSIGDAVIRTDAAGQVRQINPTAERLTGWREAEAVGKRLEEVFRIVNEDTRRAVESPVYRVLQEGIVVGLANHTVLIARDGVERPIADSAAPVRDKEGVLRGVVLVFRDQTQERAAFRSLQESESLFRTIFDMAPDPIILVGAHGQFLEANDAACRLYGYDREEIRGLNISDIGGTTAYEGSAETGLYPESGYIAATRLRRDGREVPVELAVRRISHNGAPALLGVYRDLTERIEAEKQRQSQELKYRTIVENINDALYIHDFGGTLVDVNDNACRMLGGARGDLIGKNLTDIVDASTQGVLPSYLDRLISHGSALVEATLVRKDGSALRVEASAKMVSDEGRGIIQAFVRDTTERFKALEERHKLEEQLQQAQKMEAIGRLAGGIAHDFNNVLTVIQGYSEELINGTSPAHPSRPSLEEIRKAAERAATLTAQLLAYSRRQILMPRILDLGLLVVSMEDMLRRLLGEDIDIRVHRAARLWSVRADPGRMEQVIMNLAVNSRDAMPGGGVLTIETRNVHLDESYTNGHLETRAGDYVLTAVSDTGHGMDPQTQEHMFEPFFTTKERGRGTGLGLATVYGIVKQSEGHIVCYSEKDKGTTFKVYLPRAAAECDPTKGGEVRAQLRSTGEETILLVEDDEGVRRLITATVKSAGYAVIPARNGSEALQLLSDTKNEPQLIITDVIMPGMDGKELVQLARERRPWLRALFMSGYTEDAIVHHGVLEEGVQFIQKPFSAPDLLRKVREILDARDAADIAGSAGGPT